MKKINKFYNSNSIYPIRPTNKKFNKKEVDLIETFFRSYNKQYFSLDILTNN